MLVGVGWQEMLGRILIIDDSEGETLLVKQMLREAGLDDPIYHINDSDQAIAYLSGQGLYRDRNRHPLPDIILLDLGMPGVDGYQLLKWMRQQPELASIIVIVLTGEMDPKRIQMAYQLGANSFLAKGANVDEFRNFIEFFRTYSRVANSLPQSGPAAKAPPAPLLVEPPPTKPGEQDSSSMVA